MKEILRRLGLVAQGAAMMTETEVDIKVEYGCCDMLGEKSFEDLTWENMNEIEPPVYTEEELAFAKSLQDTVDSAIKAHDQKVYEAKEKFLPKALYQETRGRKHRSPLPPTPEMSARSCR